MTNPFQWYVEGNKKKLVASDVRATSEGKTVSDLMMGLASYTRHFRDAKTNNWPGYFRCKLSAWKPMKSKEAGEKARELIPLAAYAMSLLHMYLRETQKGN